jgi:hypothetical protein
LCWLQLKNSCKGPRLSVIVLCISHLFSRKMETQILYWMLASQFCSLCWQLWRVIYLVWDKSSWDKPCCILHLWTVSGRNKATKIYIVSKNPPVIKIEYMLPLSVGINSFYACMASRTDYFNIGIRVKFVVLKY